MLRAHFLSRHLLEDCHPLRMAQDLHPRKAEEMRAKVAAMTANKETQ